MSRATFQEIILKKKYGQHFLTDQRIVDHMIDAVSIEGASVLEVGPGGGFLTKSILQQPIARLWTFEIDPDWASYIVTNYSCEQLTVFEKIFWMLTLQYLSHTNHGLCLQIFRIR